MTLLSAIVGALFVAFVTGSGVSLYVTIVERTQSAQDASVIPFYVITIGICVLGIAGLVVAITPLPFKSLIAGLLLFILASCVIYTIQSNWPNVWCVSKCIAKPVLVWATGAAVALIYTTVPTQEPAIRFTGTYPFRQWTQYTRIQALAGDYPADNFLPAIVDEFVAQGISFIAVRPIMPGQEVSNRPILASLIVLPFRIIFGKPVPSLTSLKYTMIAGTSYPDTSVLLTNDNFEIFLVIATLLNALVLIAAYLLLSVFNVQRPLLIVALTCLPSLYVLIQDFYTWPKSAAAFFVVAAFVTTYKRLCGLYVGVLLGIAYWFHPYVSVFFVSIETFLVYSAATTARSDKVESVRLFRSASMVGLGAMIVVAPWLIWTLYFLKIPSDLVQQNIAAHQSLAEHAWIRIENLGNTLIRIPNNSLQFDLPSFTRNAAISLASPVGLFFYSLTPAALIVAARRFRLMVVGAVILPILLLQIPFSSAAVPSIMGAQAIWPFLLAMSASLVQDLLSSRAITTVLLCQCLINILTSAARIYEVAPKAAIKASPSAVSRALSHGSRYSDNEAAKRSATDRRQAPLTLVQASRVALLDVPSRYSNSPVAPNLKTDIEIDGIVRSSVFSSAPAVVTFENIELKTHAMLTVNVGIHPAVYSQVSGAAADFRVSYTTHGAPTAAAKPLVDLILEPHKKFANRGWHELDTNLPRSPTPIDIIFTCAPPPDQNTYAAWCIWGNPSIIPIP